MGDLYTIRGAATDEGEKLRLGEIVSRCELLATQDGTKFFVGRETIRGRLRCGARTWGELTAPVKSHSQRVSKHKWRDGKAKPAIAKKRKVR